MKKIVSAIFLLLIYVPFLVNVADAEIDESIELISMLKNQGRDAVQSKFNSASINMAFVEAAKIGDLSRVELFLKKGLIDDIDNPGYGCWKTKTALIEAAKNDHLDVVKKLLEYGADVDKSCDYGGGVMNTAVIASFESNNIEMLKFMLDKSQQDINFQYRENYNSDHEYNLLILAVEKKWLDAIRLLIDKKADINATDSRGNNALSHLMRTDLTYIPNISEDDLLEIANLLIDAGIDVNLSKDPLSVLAAQWGHDKLVNLLLDNGAAIDARDENGVSAFMYTVFGLRYDSSEDSLIEQAKALLAKGADINAKDSAYGATPLMYALYRERLGLIEMLIDQGARIDEVDKNGNTALMLTAEHTGYPKAMKLLLDKGAYPSHRNWMGQTVFDIATNLGNSECVAVLENHVSKNCRLVKNADRSCEISSKDIPPSIKSAQYDINRISELELYHSERLAGYGSSRVSTILSFLTVDKDNFLSFIKVVVCGNFPKELKEQAEVLAPKIYYSHHVSLNEDERLSLFKMIAYSIDHQEEYILNTNRNDREVKEVNASFWQERMRDEL